MDVKKEFGEKLKRIRKSKNLTQEKLAEMIDISPRNLSGIEAGKYFVKAETLEKILNVLDITTEELFSNDHLRDSKILIKEILKILKIIKNDKAKLERIYKIIKYCHYE